MDTTLTEDQSAVYDRQLRVWGVEVQKKLTSARVLLVGFGQLAAEVAKNITLAGVGQVTLVDDRPASQQAGHNFLITIAAAAASDQTCAEAAAKTLQAMNPLVKISSSPGPAASSSSWASGLLQQHDLAIAFGLPLLQLLDMNAACRAAGIGFMAAAAAGPGGWFFVDLGQHKYQPKDSSGAVQEPYCLQYSPLVDALGVPAQKLPGSTHPMYYVLQACLALEQQVQRRLVAADLEAAQQLLSSSGGCRSSVFGPYQEAAEQLLGAVVSGDDEFAPVCAVLGGVIANNVVTAVSRSGAPLNNLLYFTLFDGRAIVETQPAAAAADVGRGSFVRAKTGAGGSPADNQQQQQQQPGESVVIDE